MDRGSTSRISRISRRRHMLNACHPATTDRYTGYFGLPGTHSDDQSRRGSHWLHGTWWYACEIDPVLEYWIFHAGVSSSGLSVLYTLNSSLLAMGGSDVFSNHFQHKPLFEEPIRYCVISNVFKVFLSSLPTDRVDRKHASYHVTRDCPALDQPKLHCQECRYDTG